MDIYCRKTLDTGDTCQTIQQIVNAIVNSDCKLVWFHPALVDWVERFLATAQSYQNSARENYSLTIWSTWGHKKEERKILRAGTSRVLTPRLGLKVSGIWHEMIHDLDDQKKEGALLHVNMAGPQCQEIYIEFRFEKYGKRFIKEQVA